MLDNMIGVANYLSRHIFKGSDTGTVEWSDAVNMINYVVKLCIIQC